MAGADVDPEDDDEDDTTVGDDVTTPGWAAIDTALARIHEDREPFHAAPIVKWALGGKDPLDGISAYRCDRDAPHWHLVSYGLSELYDKQSEDPSTSGHGLELTFRLARAPDDDQPPRWALELLQAIARRVVQTGTALVPGDHLDAHAGDLTAVIVVDDPELPAIDTAHGRLEFMQLVGVTADELDAIEAWDAGRVAELLAAANPLLITDPRRPSLLADPAAAAAIAAGIEQDGSSVGALWLDVAAIRGDRRAVQLTLGAAAVPRLGRLLRGRLLHDRPLTLRGRALEVLFEPAPLAGWQRDGEALVVSTPPPLATELADRLGLGPGVYELDALPGFTIRVAA